MVRTAKVQQTKSNTTINIPREIADKLNIKKGDTAVMVVVGDKIEISIVKED